MTKIICQISMSLDGYTAGPDQTLADPLGTRGEELHTWVFGAAREDREVDVRVGRTIGAGAGAFVMGRRMFGGAREDGSWDESWRGWWGENPPYHVPVFVLTHHPREPLAMEGGTVFHFVTEGLDAALDQAIAAAGDGHVEIAGGASTANQVLRAGRLDEIFLHTAPILLGSGTRLFEEVGTPRLEIVETFPSPAATHTRYRVVR